VTAARNFENALARAESDAVGAATTANLVLRELKRAGHAVARLTGARLGVRHRAHALVRPR